MKQRKLLFEFDSHDDDEDGVNMIRVYSDHTYTADGRPGDIIRWKVENGQVWWYGYEEWQAWDSKNFYNNLMNHIDSIILEDKEEQ